MSSKMRVGIVLVLSFLITAGGRGWAEDAGPKAAETIPAAGQAAAMIDQRALDALKTMSDTITQAKTLRFQARSMVPVRGPQGVWVNLFGLARVVARGQTALFVETRGDLFPYDLYFDGATVTAYAPAKNVYAQKEAKGTVSDLIDRAEREEGKSFPFADLLTADPYATLTGNLTRALIVGQSNINGIQTLHLAFANDGVEWQIWLGADDHLPRLVSARYLDDPAEPDYTVAFLDWKLNAPIGDDDFTFHNKTNAAKVDFRKPDGTKVFQS